LIPAALGAVAAGKTFMQFEGSDLQREEYAHLDIRRTVTGLAYVPFCLTKLFSALLELVNCDQSFPEEMLETLGEHSRTRHPRPSPLRFLTKASANTTCNPFSRVAQMYDLEKVFNSTLEMD